MKQEIEKAADEYIHRDNTTGLTRKKAFFDGARWRINSVWHDVSEKPNKNQLVLFECRKTYGKGYSVNFGENFELMKNVILSWAYIADLLPNDNDANGG